MKEKNKDLYRFHWRGGCRVFNSREDFESWIDLIDLYKLKNWWVEYGRS